MNARGDPVRYLIRRPLVDSHGNADSVRDGGLSDICSRFFTGSRLLAWIGDAIDSVKIGILIQEIARHMRARPGGAERRPSIVLA